MWPKGWVRTIGQMKVAAVGYNQAQRRTESERDLQRERERERERLQQKGRLEKTTHVVYKIMWLRREWRNGLRLPSPSRRTPSPPHLSHLDSFAHRPHCPHSHFLTATVVECERVRKKHEATATTSFSSFSCEAFFYNFSFALAAFSLFRPL